MGHPWREFILDADIIGGKMFYCLTEYAKRLAEGVKLEPRTWQDVNIDSTAPIGGLPASIS